MKNLRQALTRRASQRQVPVTEITEHTDELMRLDRSIMCLTPEAYAAFTAELDSPTQINEALLRTLRAEQGIFHPKTVLPG